jgi:hypothetical protein
MSQLFSFGCRFTPLVLVPGGEAEIASAFSPPTVADGLVRCFAAGKECSSHHWSPAFPKCVAGFLQRASGFGDIAPNIQVRFFLRVEGRPAEPVAGRNDAFALSLQLDVGSGVMRQLLC